MKKRIAVMAGLVLLCGCQKAVPKEAPKGPSDHTKEVAKGDRTAPEIGCEVDITIKEGDGFDVKDYCTWSDDRSWFPILRMYGSVDTTRVEEQTVWLTVTDEAGNLAVHEMKVSIEPQPTPEPEPPKTQQSASTPSSSYYPDTTPSYSGSVEDTDDTSYQQAGSGSGDYYTPPAGTHGTEYYRFADGYDMDSGYAACVVAMGRYGNASCTPMMNEDGIYTGYRLDY